jgi:hypothetical protein
MDDDGVDPFFEAVMQARAAEEQCPLALLHSQTGDVRPATAERPLVVERKSPQTARQARENSTDFQELCRKSRQFEASKLSSLPVDPGKQKPPPARPICQCSTRVVWALAFFAGSTPKPIHGRCAGHLGPIPLRPPIALGSKTIAFASFRVS